MREPEPETIGRARSGDLVAFEWLVREYQADVWRFAYHLTRSHATADDVTQEAFLHAFRSIATFTGEAKFSSWLLRIVRNCAIDAYRRTRREDPVAEMPPGASPGSPGAGGAGGFVATGAEERLRIARAIRSLPEPLREPFVVIEVLGFDYREASSILGVKAGTLKSRMHRARRILMRELRDEEAAGEV